VLIEGIHYFRPFGGRKILYIWETIERDMIASCTSTFGIPMADGGVVPWLVFKFARKATALSWISITKESGAVNRRL
ncbi:hypothetical protein B1A_04425, partial [mine drainage metagenome]